MFQYLKESIQLRRHQRELRRLQGIFQKAEVSARKSGETAEERRRRYFDEQFELGVDLESIGQIRTQRISRKAAKLDVQMPDRQDDKMWDDCNQIGGVMLTYEGERVLRKAIREEERTRSGHAVTIGSLFIGGLGTLTGLLLALKELGFRF